VREKQYLYHRREAKQTPPGMKTGKVRYLIFIFVRKAASSVRNNVETRVEKEEKTEHWTLYLD
jgi:hypothetical protein